MRQSGANKKIIVARLYVFIYSEVTSCKKTVEDILGVDVSWGFENVLDKWSLAHEETTVPLNVMRDIATNKSQSHHPKAVANRS